ncbi:MAG: methyltransferase domain-containing protein [Candidatus Kariarchaeaceae archaeon]|jgi:SAM-dependent methyltransferase
MKLPEPPIYTNFSKEVLAKLGNRLKEILINYSPSLLFSTKTHTLSDLFLDLLSQNDLDLLLNLRLIRTAENHKEWCFLPYLGNNLILFCDLPKYRSCEYFVWLKTDQESTSWKFAETLPIGKGMRVLDLGAGSGLLALKAGFKGALVTGIDINPRAISLALLNRDLNGQNTVDFQICNWKQFCASDFDLIVTQPPFDPHIAGVTPSFAFDSKGPYGLQATKEIVTRFLPRNKQILALYVHAFENKQDFHFRSLLTKWIADDLISIDLHLKKSYSITKWWDNFKVRRGLDTVKPLPKNLLPFSQRSAYFVILQRKEC